MNYRDSYRKDKKVTHQFNLKAKVIVSSLTIGLICSAGFSAFQAKMVANTRTQLASLKLNMEEQNNELDILRALNPYQYAYEQLIPNAVEDGEVFPGWVTRVYATPGNEKENLSKMDMGAFILDQTQFNLGVHRNYGLDTPDNVLYRMNGLLPSKRKGRYQIGIEFNFEQKSSAETAQSTRILECFAQLHVNQKRVIDSHIRFNANQKLDKMITGDVMVSEGVHPISARIYCDDNKHLDGESVKISMSFRAPGAINLQKNKHSVFHIYKPSKI